MSAVPNPVPLVQMQIGRRRGFSQLSQRRFAAVKPALPVPLAAPNSRKVWKAPGFVPIIYAAQRSSCTKRPRGADGIVDKG